MAKNLVNIRKQISSTLPKGWEKWSKPKLYRYLRGKGVPAKAAARLSGYSVDRVDQMKIAKDDVSVVLDCVGATVEAAASTMAEGLKAKKYVCVGKDEYVEVEDHSVRKGYAQMVMEMHGHSTKNVGSSEKVGNMVVMNDVVINGKVIDFYDEDNEKREVVEAEVVSE